MTDHQLRFRAFALAVLVWTGLIAASLFWNLHNDEKQIMDLAYAEAKANLDKDITFRRWGNMHGGVYVPITPTQQSVPWLAHVPGRDVMTTQGQQLTLLNPASMLRQMMDLYSKEYGVRGRIIGLRYLNPGNAPDAWESEQLEAFDRGEKKEVWGIVTVEGKQQLRYLRAMFMDPGCDKCHGILGYKTGDMRGATGLILPLDAYTSQIVQSRWYLGGSHLAIWLIGVLGILWVRRYGERWSREKEKIYLELLQHRLRLQGLVETRTQELMKTRARAEQILNSTADGLFGLDTDGRITFVNPAACRMLGYSAERMIGAHSHSLFHHTRADGTPYPPGRCPTYSTLISGVEVRVTDEVYWHADGHPLPVMYASHPILDDGKVVGVVTSFVDMSAEREMAAAREQALQASESLSRARSEFLANMSHEIRTPLHGVLGFAEIGMRHSDKPERVQEAFGRIIASGKRLLGVVNDILDFSKLEAGKLLIEQTPVALSEVIEQTLALLEGSAQKKGIALTVTMASNVPSTCLSDSLRLGQVLLNVLSNAVKFTDQGRVALRVERDNEWLRFTVQDTGIGMSQTQLGQLYTPFQQADASATRRFGGTGLGLAITRRILEQMGGKIAIRSVSGEGTTVVITLPYIPASLARRQELTQVPEGEIGQRLLGLRILVAEDEPINQAILEENLREEGAEVVLVGNGRDALAQVAEHPQTFDLVLMDLQMPEMSGLEATREILAIAPDLPIIAQTAHAFEEERERCLEAGMVDHISKPIDTGLLLTILARHRAQKAL